MSEKRYELLKDYEDPCGRVSKGVIKTEYQWMARFALLNEGDCAVKTDWFKEFVELYPDPYEQIAKICELTNQGGNLYTDKHMNYYLLSKYGFHSIPGTIPYICHTPHDPHHTNNSHTDHFN